MARPVIAKRQAEMALKSVPDGLSMVPRQRANAQVRFELALPGDPPNVQLIAPWSEWDID